VLLVISPAPVLGLALIEELAQPIGARGASDFFLSVMWNHDPEITGYMEFDMEAWALDAARFEALLARLNEMKKVVLLSGDVHYACSAELDYWKKNQPTPSRIVQLTASALKNDWGVAAKRALETVAGQEILHNAFYPVERMGWESPIDLVGEVHVPGDDLPRTKRAMLRRTPVVLPTEGWAPGSSISVDPDWAWRMRLVKDERPDDDSEGARPADGQASKISPDLVPGDPVDGYVAVLQRGEKQLKVKIARSVVFHSNLGRVTFSGTGETLKVLHELMYVHPSGDKKAKDPQAYTAHEISLDTSSESEPRIT
jgi:hypothetical protein